MATGSISIQGLLTGTAGQIDVTSLISSLMSAAQVPQEMLQNQVTTQQNFMSVYQSLNTEMTALQSAAKDLTSSLTWVTRSATSSDASVVANATGFPMEGTTTFTVTSTAAAQITTIKVGADGSLFGDSDEQNPNSLTITNTASNSAFSVDITGAKSVTDVASAINNQSGSAGVKATVVHTDSGDVLQITSNSTGSDGAFSVSANGLSAGVSAPTDIQAAANAQVAIGQGSGAYTITSQTNTFDSAIPGVTFTVSKPGVTATIGVSLSSQSIADKLSTLVNAANTAAADLHSSTAQGSPLQGTSALNQLIQGISSAVSKGSATGGSLKDWGIDIDKTGQMSFDAETFLAAYNANPATGQQIVKGFAQSLQDTATSAVDGSTGSLTLKINEITSQEDRLNASITSWNDRLDMMKTNLQSKFLAMQTTLATLQSQGNYLTSAFKSLTSSSDSSS